MTRVCGKKKTADMNAPAVGSTQQPAPCNGDVCCVFIPTISALHRKCLFRESMPCTSPNSHGLQCSTHRNRLQLFYDAVPALSFTMIPAIVLYHTWPVRDFHCLRQTVFPNYRCVHPVDRVGKVFKSTLQRTSVGLAATTRSPQTLPK